MSLSAPHRHAARIQAAVESNEAARSALVASWRRSAAFHHLDPAERKPPQRISGAALAEAREHLEPLLHAAGPSLDRLYQAVGGIGCCVLLAGRDGVPVERRGAVADDADFQDWGLWTGTVWSEESEGTNGIGTCLVENRALTIHRDQHFFTRNTLLSCTTAPLYDHEGRLAGALDVSSCRGDLTEGFVGLIAVAVADAARRIEAAAFRQAFPQARVILAPGSEPAAGALLAVDRSDLVIGASRAARQAHGITAERLRRGLPAADLLGSGGGYEGELWQAERAILERALLRTGGNVSAAARALGVSRATLHRKMTKLALRGAA